MDVKLCQLILLIGIVQLSLEFSLPADPTYRAGVVEFAPERTGSAIERTRANLQRFKEIIESPEASDLDILVFPEYVLNNMGQKTYVPDPRDAISPCIITDYDWFLTELSCAARSRQTYLVVNLIEKELCTSPSSLPTTTPNVTACDASGLHTYNTNVVFDRTGRVISRYRKTHLYRYEWYSTNVRPSPELAIFNTDFGVTFGHFICFDMLFYTPAQLLIDKYNITDIIYPTYWFSELPFLTAVQMQEGWAYANNVNLLAADASVPTQQNTGSGIYAGKLGRLNATIQEIPQTRLLTATVPKRRSNASTTHELPTFVQQLETPRLTKVALLRDYNVDIFTTELLAANFTNVTHRLCHADTAFCCDFSAQRQLISETMLHAAYRYRLVAYSGANATHQRMDRSELSVCAIIACTGAELYTCGHIYPSAVSVANFYYFSGLRVSGGFRHASQRLIMPNSVDGMLMPLLVDMYEMKLVEESSSKRNQTLVSIELTAPKLDLLTFGIWANYFHPAVGKHNLDPAALLLNAPPSLVNAAASMLQGNKFSQIYMRTLLLAFVLVAIWWK